MKTENNQTQEELNNLQSQSNVEPQLASAEQSNKEDTTENILESTSNETVNSEEKFNELNNKYLRLYSEFENYKKRTAKERIEFAKSAAQDVFVAILPVIDDFERAIKSNETLEDINAIKEGFRLIHHKFTSILAKKGLEPMDVINKEFNADFHEAITNIPASSEDLKGKIVDEIEKGYLLNGKVIRYAKVVVGS